MRGCGGMAHSTPTYLPGTSPPVFSHMPPAAPFGAHEPMAVGPVSPSILKVNFNVVNAFVKCNCMLGHIRKTRKSQPQS